MLRQSAPVGGEVLDALPLRRIERVERVEQRTLHAAGFERPQRRVPPSVGEDRVRLVGEGRSGPLADQSLAIPQDRVVLLVDVGPRVPRGVLGLDHPVLQLA
jgi:hypothetical protein